MTNDGFAEVFDRVVTRGLMRFDDITRWAGEGFQAFLGPAGTGVIRHFREVGFAYGNAEWPSWERVLGGVISLVKAGGLAYGVVHL